MAARALHREERAGLAIAIAAHVAIFALLVLHKPRADLKLPEQRIEVSIGEVADQSSSPSPTSRAAPDRAPEIGEAPPPPAPEALPQPLPQAVPQPAPQPPMRSPVQPRLAPTPAPAPRPAPRAPAPRPARPAPREAAPPAKPPKASAPSKSAASSKSSSAPAKSPARPAKSVPEKAGGSKIGADFLDGVKGAEADSGKAAPAALTGAVKSSLAGSIRRQLKPHWSVPQGADAEKLVTRVRFRLNRDGSLAGGPQVLGTTGVTPANEAQVQRHQEQAVRAIKLAAPFDLPDEYYDGWKVITSTFDRNL